MKDYTLFGFIGLFISIVVFCIIIESTVFIEINDVFKGKVSQIVLLSE